VPAPAPVTPAAVVLPPDQFAPPGSQTLYQLGAFATIIGPGTTAILVGSAFQLGRQQVARIQTVGVQALATAATSLITFQLLVGGAPFPGLTFQIPSAPLAVYARDYDVYAVLPAGAALALSVTVGDAAAYQVQAFYLGYVYSLSAQQRYYGALGNVLS
jgi:hypothetical protein